MPNPVLATKLFAPIRRPQYIARPRLVERLDTTLEAGNRLTLVSAPAGFGKTTMLGEWLTHLSSRPQETHVAWLSLDAGDNDLPRLLSHLAAALRGVGIDIDADLDSSVVLTAIVNDVARAAAATPGTHWVLALDDYHVITSSDVHAAATFLLDHTPPQLHLLVATRSDPPLPLPRLRSRGDLTEVRAADLRFTRPEAREFLTAGMGLDLSAADVAALEERTEGWIAGLQLAALSLRGMVEGDEVADFIGAFTGSNRFVIDYLADEVLARQPVEVRDFLLNTAILERLSASLCDAVTGCGDARHTLEVLDRDNLFLVPLDDERSWYRYHHLFADALQARLLAEHPDRARELHRRASAWYATHHLSVDAVRHALAAEDVDRAAFLVEDAVPRMRRARQDHVLLAWIGALPDSVVRRSPVLSIVSGWSHLMAGNLDELELRLDDAAAALAAAEQDPELGRAWADTEDLRNAPATISVYRASLAQARGDVAGTVHHAQRALDLAGPEDHLIRGAGGGYLGLAAWAAGNVTEALDTFGGAVHSLHAAGNLVDELDMTVVLADMWVASGRPTRARQLYERALQAATSRGATHQRAAADLHVGLAELDRERDDLPTAKAHLETARVLAERASISENRHRWYVAMALVRVAERDFDAALHLLDEAESLFRPGFYPDVRPIAAMRARVQIAQGDLAAAEEWAREHAVPADEETSYLREYEILTLVRLRLAHHRQLDRTADLLDRLHAHADPSRAGSLIEIGMLRALIHDAQGHRAQSLAVLAQALAQAPEPASYVRLFLDEGDPMIALVNLASRDDTSPDALADPLSGRELDVLRLLDSELTGPQIARELYVSLNTLRTHTKRIFTKLDVNTRAAAVRRAHELRIL
ncbi:MAG: LuxR C-terminal-related transcriptional regulator [Nocardioides sp.]